ncbi:unnamed protein product [marine sediment metagenome]|uniref:Uncharacterized protein n=1 Tax=marine sediment metagenome TaxID=412755 RepID=X1Q2M3_9ZZZZ
MGRKNLLDVAVPRLRNHMAEKGVALTTGETAGLLSVSTTSAFNVLTYMEATDVVQHIRRRKNFYYLKDAYEDERLAEILIEAGERSPPEHRRSIYDPVLDRFLESGYGLVEVKVEGKSGYYLRQALDRRIKTRGLGIKATIVSEVVYLEKA